MELALDTLLPASEKRLNLFERYLTVWVGLCMVGGVLLGQWFPGMVSLLRSREFGEGSHINVPIAILIWLMIIPMMMKVACLNRRSNRPQKMSGNQAVV